MADFNSSQPVRTESVGDIDIFVSDSTTPSQKLKVNADGSIDTNFAAGSQIQITDGTDTLAVNADGSINTNFAAGSQIQITDGTDTLAVNADGSLNSVVTATDLDIRNLAAAQDNVAISDGTDTLAINADGSINTNFAAGAQIQITDGTDTLAVNADGSLNITDNGGSITVDGAVTVSATDLDIRNLSAAQDNVAISDGTDTMAVNVDGSLNVVATATDLDIRDLTSASDSVSVLQATHDNLNLNANLQVGDADVGVGNPVPISDNGGSLTVDGSVTVSATDLDIRDLSAAQDNVAISDGTDTLAVNTDGSINVRVSDRSGTERLDYDTAAAVASAATDNHDYTTLATFRLTQVQVTASSRMKAEIQLETGAATNVFNTIAVVFTTESNLNADVKFDSPPQVVSGARVRVIRTNRDNQAQDLYSTIVGFEE